MTLETSMTASPPAESLAHFLVAVSGALVIGIVAQAMLPHLSQPRAQTAAATEPAEQAAPSPPPVTALTFGEPVPGYPVISPFGLRQLPWEEHGRLHAGVDIAAPAGAPVRVTAHGVVLRAGRDGAYGRFVEVRHATGLSSLYAHMGSIGANIRPGVALMKGAPVGSIGSSGSSTGAHLHFEVRDRKGRPLDPEAFIDHRFETAADLPLTAAARFTRRIRVAYVSNIPASKRELMEAREVEKEQAKSDLVQARKLAAAARLARSAPKPAPLLVFEPMPQQQASSGGEDKARVHATLSTAG